MRIVLSSSTRCCRITYSVLGGILLTNTFVPHTTLSVATCSRFYKCSVVAAMLMSLLQLFVPAHITIYPIMCLNYVDIRSMQVVILALSPREISQTDRILPKYILSRVRVSVRPRIVYTRKKNANHCRPHTSIRAAEINNGIGPLPIDCFTVGR